MSLKVEKPLGLTESKVTDSQPGPCAQFGKWIIETLKPTGNDTCFTIIAKVAGIAALSLTLLVLAIPTLGMSLIGAFIIGYQGYQLLKKENSQGEAPGRFLEQNKPKPLTTNNQQRNKEPVINSKKPANVSVKGKSTSDLIKEHNTLVEETMASIFAIKNKIAGSSFGDFQTKEKRTKIEREHQKCRELFESCQAIGREVMNRTVNSDENAMLKASELDAQIGNSWSALNDSLLTLCPYLAITTGRALVEPETELAKVGAVRKIRGDGNCFYASMAVAYLDQYAKLTPVEKKEESKRFLGLISSFTAKDPYLNKLIKDALDSIAPGTKDEVFANEAIMFSFVYLLRQLTASQMKEGLKDVKSENERKITLEHIRDKVEKMGQEADYLEIQALFIILQVNLSIKGNQEVDFNYADGFGNGLHLIREGAHYFVKIV